MKVALIGDVHANLPALEAVLDHAQGQGVEAIWNVGDFVGYGAFPNQVIKRLKQEDAVSIVGNYDLKALRFKKKRKKWRKKKHPLKFLAFQWTRDALTKKSRKYLRSLPRTRTVLYPLKDTEGEESENREGERQAEGLRVLLTHGSPASEKEHLTPDTPEERLRELASMAEADVVICGHSHRGFVHQVDGGIDGIPVHFINTGSVGRPDDGDPRACYAILQIEPGAEAPRLQVQHHRLAYDVERAVAAIHEHKLPEAFAQMAIQGYALDDVMVAPETWEAPAPKALPWGGEEGERRIRKVLELAESCDYEVEHTHRVTHLALRLFDELQPLHHLGAEERFWLRCGALLHDIGWIEGQKRHHKTSLRLILDASDLPFDDRGRHIIGSIARYHRRALPKDKHDHFAALSPVDQYHVTTLAALLRVADGLDRTHRNVVEDLSCEVSPRQITVCCAVRMYPIPERKWALKKGDLLERVFDRELVVTWRLV